jgi:GR25 family glycosyltransferase involved in LPS biosynthesis
MYQFVVISACDERRHKMIKQCNEFNILNQTIFLDNPSTIGNSESYFPINETMINKKVMCCARSHLRALELASKDESPDFTIILEDDVAFHKTKFVDGINEIINNWDKITNNSTLKMISVGWVPCNKYDNYSGIHPYYKMKTISGVNILDDRYIVGLQAYIVKKTDMKKHSTLFGHSSYNELENAIHSLNKQLSTLEIDNYINRIFNQCYTFPPLAIEQDTRSLLRDYKLQRSYWNNFFKDIEHVMKEYWSYD